MEGEGRQAGKTLKEAPPLPLRAPAPKRSCSGSSGSGSSFLLAVSLAPSAAWLSFLSDAAAAAAFATGRRRRQPLGGVDDDLTQARSGAVAGAGDWLARAQRHFKACEGATIVVEWAELIIVLHTSKKNAVPLIYQYKKRSSERRRALRGMATSLLGVSLRVPPPLAALIGASFLLARMGAGLK